MPELPEVETIARKLRPVLVGRTIVSVEVLWERTVDRPDLGVFHKWLVGARVMEVMRRGKFIVISLDTGQTLLVHLRMSGKFLVRETGVESEEDSHTRLRFRLDNDIWVDYIDPRKFGRFYLTDTPEDIVGKLGPEPLSPAFTADVLWEQLQNRRSEIKRLLLNQSFVAGLGNIYASEALWRARIHPQRAAGTLTQEESQRLYAAIVTTLHVAVGNGGTSLGDRQYVYPDGNLGRHQEQLCVYDRADDRCPRCGYAIRRIVQGQRSTYFCPVCQVKSEELGVKSEE